MKFLGYLSKVLTEIISEEDILLRVQGCNVFKEDDGIKLAIELPNSHQAICALFAWNEFHKLSDTEKYLTMQQQKTDFINIYQETWGLLSVIEPNTILKEAKIIIQFYSSDREYLDDNSTTIIEKNGNVRLETDANNSVWFVLVGTNCYSVSNKNAAIQLFRLISKDIENFIRVRWSI
jgi:hypothetical protein